MKGGAWNLNAVALGEAARMLEETATAREEEAAHSVFASLQKELERFKNAAAAYISNVMPTGQ